MERIFAVLLLFVAITYSQLAFPEEHSSESTNNSQGRQPVYLPGVCPINQWYWPGDKESDWVCDCATRFVYHPASDSCHEVYRQGPCQKGEYLTLETGRIIPECVRNPCVNDTMVPFNDNCFRLYKTDGCPSVGKLQRRLTVNSTTLKLECVLDKTTQLINEIHVDKTACLPGSKRSALGKCTKITK